MSTNLRPDKNPRARRNPAVLLSVAIGAEDVSARFMREQALFDLARAVAIRLVEQASIQQTVQE